MDMTNEEAARYIGKMSTGGLNVLESHALVVAWNLLRKTQWIDVKDKLPKDGEIVLTYRAPSKYDIGERMHVESCMSGIWGGDAPYLGDVTHWMQLPDPPEEE